MKKRYKIYNLVFKNVYTLLQLPVDLLKTREKKSITDVHILDISTSAMDFLVSQTILPTYKNVYYFNFNDVLNDERAVANQ